MSNRQNIVIAKIDLDSEKINKINVTPPSFVLFKSGDNSMIEFSKKKKTLESLQKFTEQHCRVNLAKSNSLRDRNKKIDIRDTDKFLRDEL